MPRRKPRRHRWSLFVLATLGLLPGRGDGTVDDDLYVATLRGRRLLRVTFAPDLMSSRVATLFDRSYGRLRDVIVGPDHALYVATSSRDARGQPISVNDRILRVPQGDPLSRHFQREDRRRTRTC